MPLKSCFHGCGKSAESVSRLALVLVLLTCVAGPTTAQPPDDAARQYREQQQHLVQDLRAISDSLLTDELKEQFVSAERIYRSVIRTGTNSTSGPEFAALQTGLRYRIFALSDLETQKDSQGIINAFTTLSRDVSAARSITNPEDQKRFREMVCRESLPLIEKVINEGNLTGRSAAIGILPEMEMLSPSALQRRLEMCDDVDDLLIRILKNEKQPDFVKLRAASAVKTYLEKADAVPQVELALANALAGELQKPQTEWEYQYFLIEAFSRIRAPREVVGVKKAVVIETAADVMQDVRRDILVRCHAAGVLGKAGFDSQVNFEPLAWKTVQLAVETAVNIGQKTPRHLQERRELCGWHLYLAFHHETEKGKADRRNPEGMLNRTPSSALVRAAYDQVLPIAKSLMFSDHAVPNDEILKANDWVKKNQPADLTFDAVSPPLKP